MTKLEQMLKYVSEHNDFYKKRIKEYGITNPLDITQWPILTRKELQENRYNMFSDGYKSKYFNQQLRRQSSSGSTGMPVNVYWDYKDWYASNMCLWRKRREWYGITPLDRNIVFTLNSFGTNNLKTNMYMEKSNTLFVNTSLLLKMEEYDDLISLIEKYRPAWLYIQPSVLMKLQQAYARNSVEPSNAIRYIETVGETLLPTIQKKAFMFWNVPIVNMYGSEEMNGIAYNCPAGHMHTLSDNVFLECKTRNGLYSCGEGGAVITSLNNHAMPLIRYEQGDIISMKCLELNCSFCTNSINVLAIKGRILNSITIDNHIELNQLMLLEIIAEINNEDSDIIVEYKYVYNNRVKFLQCYIQLDRKRTNWFRIVKDQLESLFYQKYTCGLVSFEVIEAKPELLSGQKCTLLIME